MAEYPVRLSINFSLMNRLDAKRRVRDTRVIGNDRKPISAKETQMPAAV